MFYMFDQNNSGGSFIKDDTLAHFVIIEADSAKEANEIAESKGIYFDGCETGDDCPCCGDRWSSQYDDKDGEETAMIYSKDPSEYDDMFASKGEPYCYVYEKDGVVRKYIKN